MGKNKIIMKKIFIILFSLLVINESKGQITKCGSEINLPLIQQNNPTRYQRIIALEQHTQNYIASVNNGNNTSRLITPNATIIIPVVVHVLHRGEAIGAGRNISVAQIQSQIDVLNEDFRRLNADRVNTPAAFQPVAGDPNFEFRLACTDPTGNPTTGITRTFAGQNQFNPLGNINPSDGSFNEQAIGIKFTNAGGRDAWPTSRYLNIWVCDMGGGMIGYGQFPYEYTLKPTTDGVVMLYNAFGRVGNLQFGLDKGRVCVHEIGHWLNLRHIWGDANCGNDFVDDTPTQQTSNGSCPAFPHITCANGTNGDMFMNYMDYTNNGCMNIYTRGQSLRMRAVFAQGGPRAAFIDNYFNVNQPSAPICNTGTVTANNPMCLPVTWTIVSGPASIISGQGTNTVTLQKTGNGIATVTATAAGYIDSKEVIFGIGTNSINYTQKSITCVAGRPYFYGAVAEVPFAGNNYDWYSKDMSNVNNPFVLKQSGLGNTADFPLGNNKGNRYYTIRVIATTPCGSLQSINEDGYLFAPSCIGGGNLKITTFPNPTSSNFSILLIGDNGQISSATNENILETELVNKMGTVLQKAKYTQGTKQVSLNIATLSPDVYILRIWDGKEWSSVSVIKK